MRVWDGKLTKEEVESLDYSGNKGQNGDSDNLSAVNPQNLVDQNQLGQFQDGHYEVKDLDQGYDEDEFEDDYDGTNDVSTASGSSLFSFFKTITGQKEITERDLDPVLAKMKEH